MAAMWKHGLLSYSTLDGAGNRVQQSEFLDKLFQESYSQHISDAVIIMENASFHHSREIKDKINSTGHELLFLPTYIHFYNPIK